VISSKTLHVLDEFSVYGHLFWPVKKKLRIKRHFVVIRAQKWRCAPLP
jgi:hypothetical protein